MIRAAFTYSVAASICLLNIFLHEGEDGLLELIVPVKIKRGAAEKCDLGAEPFRENAPEDLEAKNAELVNDVGDEAEKAGKVPPILQRQLDVGAERVLLEEGELVALGRESEQRELAGRADVGVEQKAAPPLRVAHGERQNPLQRHPEVAQRLGAQQLRGQPRRYQAKQAAAAADFHLLQYCQHLRPKVARRDLRVRRH